MLIIARELAVTSLRVVAISEGKLMAAAKSGKWKTASQFFYIILMLLHIASMAFVPYPLVIEQAAQWVVVAITLWVDSTIFIKTGKLSRQRFLKFCYILQCSAAEDGRLKAPVCGLEQIREKSTKERVFLCCFITA